MLHVPLPGSTPRLPLDVLSVIASHSERWDLLSLMLVNRDLHDVCAKYVLEQDVHLRDSADVISFICFMRPGRRKRWRFLRALVFEGGPLSPLAAAEFARVIPRAINLKRLVFKRAEVTLGAHLDLALAFASLPKVKHVRIEKGYQHTCRMLEAMHWPLETVSLYKTSYVRSWRDSDKLDRLHPARLLQNSRATLKYIKCESWNECSDVLPTYPVYPELHTLSVQGVWCPRSTQWVKCFPNLKHLTVGTYEDHFMDMDGESLLNYASSRRRNIEEHAHIEGGAVWSTLESFVGGTLDVYLLGLPCRIRSISLPLCEGSHRFLSTAMEVALPTHLSLSVSCSSTPGAIVTGLPWCLRGPGMRELEHLELSFYLIIPERKTSVENIMDQILVTLSNLTVRELSLTMVCHKFPYSHEADTDDDGPPPAKPLPCPVELWFTSFDPKAISQELLDAVPSLHRLNLSVGFETKPKAQVYVRGEGGAATSYFTLDVPKGLSRADFALFGMHECSF